MQSIPKISIIVAVYKVEAYLDRCIQSIINQTYYNLEIILIDDGSPDNCGRICDEYAWKENRIKVIHKKNGGAADAKNAGIEIATGEYLGIVDSDDFIHPEMYETLYANLLKTGSDISICSFGKVYDNRMILDNRKNEVLTMSNIEGLECLFTFDCVNFNVPWNKLYKKELFDGIRYPKGNVRDDESTTYKLIFTSKRIAITQRVMYYYFQNVNGIMHNKSLKVEVDYADAMEERINFFASNNKKDFYVRTLKRYCIWLICTAYRYRKKRRKEPDLYAEIKRRRRKYIDRLLIEFRLPKVCKVLYLYARKESYLLGFFAFHKLYRYDFLSKLAGIMFDDQKSLL